MNAKTKTTGLVALAFVIPALLSTAATNVTLQNFQGTKEGAPIVDNAGVPIDRSLTSWSVGTFDPGYWVVLPTLDTLTADKEVLDNFNPSGIKGSLSLNGLFNGSVQADEGNFNHGRNIFALVQYDSPSGLQVLVYNVSTPFPKQDEAGNASVDLGRIMVASDVAFGNKTPVKVDTDALPDIFSGFTTGVTFDAVPEPSTLLYAITPLLVIVLRRKRT